MLETSTIRVPLAADADAVLRVGGTRVTLESVMAAWDQGASAEEIALRFPTVDVRDVYAVLAWAVQNPAEVQRYMRDREAKSTSAEEAATARHGLTGLRERLLARRA